MGRPDAVLLGVSGASPLVLPALTAPASSLSLFISRRPVPLKYYRDGEYFDGTGYLPWNGPRHIRCAIERHRTKELQGFVAPFK